MVRLTIALTPASAAAARDLVDALRLIASRTRLEPGCIGCSLSNHDTVRYVEEWSTEADMRRRVRSEAFTSVLAIVESAVDPTVRFDFVATTRGLDYVSEVRNMVS
jgi:quinol monooxygenase YgiN